MSSSRSPRLWLALRPLNLPLQALGLAHSPVAIAILENQHVISANETAKKAGVQPGMDATTARLLAECAIHARRADLEQQLLHEMAEQLYTCTPHIDFYQSKSQLEAGLLLEISRSLKLFSGLMPLCNKVFSTVSDMDTAHGLAHSAPAAWLLSYQQHLVTGNENKILSMARLEQTPIQLLYDFPEAVKSLEKSGFTTIGDIVRHIKTQSIASIKKRCGEDFSRYMSEVCDIDQDFQQNRLFDMPVATYQPAEFFFDTLQLDYPASELSHLSGALEIMLKKFAQYLLKRQLSCQHIEWALYDIDQRAERIKIHCDKSQSHWQLLYELTLIQLESRQLPFAVDAVELICRHTQKHQQENQTLDFGGPASTNSHYNLAIIQAKLKARLGEQAIFKISYHDSHIPESSNPKIPVFAIAKQQLPAILNHNPRPSWVFDNPLPIQHRRQTLHWRGDLQLITGPERIENQWWDAPIARDYYVVRRDDGLRVWAYQDLLSNKWFVQGVFG